MKNTKIIIGIVVAIAIILVVIALLPSDRSSDSKQSSEPQSQYDPISGELIPVPVETAPPVPDVEESAKGLYYAECIVPGAGTQIGQIEVDKGVNPFTLESVSIKNVNTGNETKVDVKTATCTFNPVN